MNGKESTSLWSWKVGKGQTAANYIKPLKSHCDLLIWNAAAQNQKAFSWNNFQMHHMEKQLISNVTSEVGVYFRRC